MNLVLLGDFFQLKCNKLLKEEINFKLNTVSNLSNMSYLGEEKTQYLPSSEIKYGKIFGVKVEI